MNQNNNPLQKHFRQPSIYIQLTSKGQFWKDGAVDLGVTGELPIYPMTAKDEVTLRTPDALLNGTSVVDVIQSCCPNIKNAWEMPSVDVDSTLIAIRIASYGQSMGVTSKCPKCNEEHDYDIDLHNVLAQIRMPDYNKTLTTTDGLVIKFKPINYLQVSKAAGIVFEEEKLIRALADTTTDEEVRKLDFAKRVDNMVNLNNENITNATESITAEGTIVSDPKFISEYYQNAQGSVLREVQDMIKQFSEEVSIKPIDTLCTSCNHEFKLNVEFDYSHFFAKGS
jgi:hypothetical protein